MRSKGASDLAARTGRETRNPSCTGTSTTNEVRLTLKAVNAELARRGHRALLAKGDGYFYFSSGEATDWLDRTVRVSKLSDFTVEQWVQEFERLKRNAIRRFESRLGRAGSVPNEPSISLATRNCP